MLNRDIELKEFNRKRQEDIATNQKISMTVGFFDSLDIAAIFAMFIKPILHKFLEEIGKYFMFPIAAGASIVQAGLKWYQVYLDGGKPRSIAEASVDTAAAVAITTAVVGALAFPLIFAAATSIIFTATLGGKTLWSAGSALYYLVKGCTATTPEARKENLEKAKGNAIATVAGIVSTAAVVGVFMLGHFALAGLGVAAGLFGAGYVLYKGISMYRASQKKKKLALSDQSPLLGDEPEQKPEPASRLVNGAKMVKSLRASYDGTPSWANRERQDQAPKVTTADRKELKISRSGSFGLLAAPRPKPVVAEEQVNSLGFKQTA